MNAQRFEAKVLELWLTTRIPLTRPHLQHLTGLSRKKLERLLESMVETGALLENFDAGERTFSVPDAARPAVGARTVGEYEKLRDLSPKAKPGELSSSLALVKAGSRAMAGQRTEIASEDRKSLLISGALSLLLGPFGWLYAGSFREVLPACGVALLVLAIVPGFLLTPMLGVLAPISAVGGLLYAWQHNRHGERVRLLGESPSSRD